MLEETGLPYRILPVNINQGDPFKREFLEISPNNKMPAIVDAENGLSLFESGAILQFLAEKTGKHLPADTTGKYTVLQASRPRSHDSTRCSTRSSASTNTSRATTRSWTSPHGLGWCATTGGARSSKTFRT